MGQSFFIWNGVDCRSMGIIMRGPAAIIRPEERVRHVEIPGRSGDLTRIEGENIYNSYIQTVSISVRGGFRVRDVYKWLRGAGYVTFSGEPDRRQPARIIGAITLNRVSRNIDNWAGEVQFYCQPLKELLQARNTDVAPNATVRNNGDVTERPEWSFTATGTSALISAGGKSLAITGLVAGNAYLIRSDVCMAMTADRQEDLTENTVGDFPVLEPGDNTVTGSGWSTITIWRRERFL